MATGLLILGVGPSTRLLTHLVGLDKTYEATIRLGVATTTDDADGESVSVVPARYSTTGAGGLNGGILQDEISRLTGEISQRPSAVSAIKVDGVRAYERVRAGEQVELAERRVTVHSFDVLDVREGATSAGEHDPGDWSPSPVVDLDVRVRCSSGTYIRALARDLGERLGVGGHLTALRRTAVGPFLVEDAAPVPERVSGAQSASSPLGSEVVAQPPIPLLAPAEVAGRLFPVVHLTGIEAADLANGKRLELDAPDAPITAAVAPDGRLVGLVEVRQRRTRVLTNFPVV